MDFICQGCASIHPREYVTCVRSMGPLLVASTTHDTLRLVSYDAETLAPVFPFPMDFHVQGHSAKAKITGLAPSTETVLLTSFEDGMVAVFDIRAQGPVGTLMIGQRRDTQCLATSSDSRGMVCAGDGKDIVIADMMARKVLTRNDSHHSDTVTALSWSPHKASMICSGGEDGLVNVTDLADPHELHAVVSLNEPVARLAFSPSGVIYGHTTLENCFAVLADSGEIVSKVDRRDESTYVADVLLLGGDPFVVLGRHGEDFESVCGNVECWTMSQSPYTHVATLAGAHKDIVRSMTQIKGGGADIMPYCRIATGSEDGSLAVWRVAEVWKEVGGDTEEVAPLLQRVSGRSGPKETVAGGANRTKPYHKKR